MSSSIANKVWITVRFAVFGIGGLLLMLVAWVFFLDRLTSQHNQSVWPLVFAPMGVFGAVSMLYGVGEWGRWAYLGVFLSFPLSMLLWFLPFYPQGKSEGVLGPALVVVVAYFLAKRHYSRAALHKLRR